MTADTITAIKKALEGVSPGPWEVYSEKVADKAAAIAESTYQVEHTEPFVGEIFMLNGGGKCPALTGCGPCSEANARYIAAVNPVAISELLSTLESLQRENEHLREDRDRTARNRDMYKGQVERQADNLSWYRSGSFAHSVNEHLSSAGISISGDILHDCIRRTAIASTGGEHHADK